MECVVRGYLAGSGWKEYQESQSVCGEKLPAGLQLASQLPEPIFTPATKSDTGHDLNIDWNECRRILGNEMAERARDLSLQIYSAGSDHAAQRGIIVADTKFEFGTVDGELVLIDECLTLDSSRFWPKDYTRSGKVLRVSTSNLCAITWKRSIGTKRASGSAAAEGCHRKNFRKISRSFPLPNE